MNAIVTTLAKQASALSAEERVALAEVLLESVQVEPSAEIEQAWREEIERRVAEVNAGSAQLVNSADVYAKARQLLS
jgi:putative addiction module component (TIGR02574 family)